MLKGATATLDLRVTGLNSSRSYSTSVTTDDDSIGFDKTCNSQLSFSTASNAQSYTTRVTLHACDTPGGKLTVSVRDKDSGNLVAATSSDVLVVYMGFRSLPQPPVMVQGRPLKFDVVVYPTLSSTHHYNVVALKPGPQDCSFDEPVSVRLPYRSHKVLQPFSLKCQSPMPSLSISVALVVTDRSTSQQSMVAQRTIRLAVLKSPSSYYGDELTFKSVGDNSSTTMSIYPTSTTTRVRINVSEQKNRAYVLNVQGVDLKGKEADANHLTLHVDPGNYERPPRYSHMGGNELVWVATSTRDRKIAFEVVSPFLYADDRKLSRYDITVSKPDVAIIERPISSRSPASATSGAVVLPLKVRNSSTSRAEVDVGVHCNLRRGDTPLGSGARSHGTFYVNPGPSREIDLAVTSICGEIALQENDEISLAAYLLAEDGYRQQAAFASSTVVWEHNATSTLFEYASADLAGGMQVLIGDSSCTSSFTLDYEASTIVRAVSTTGHCAKTLGDDWLHRGYGGATTTLANTWALPLQTSCGMLTATSSTSTQSCVIGDQSYAWISVSGTDTGYIFRPNKEASSTNAVARPKLEYFTKAASARFKTVGARPPRDRDVVHKVGRTTGWTSGLVDSTIGNPKAQTDPTCSGGPRGTEDNKHLGSRGYLECLAHAEFAAEPGDSGSPVFVRTQVSNEVVLVGVVYAKIRNSISFIPIDRIYAEAVRQGDDWSAKTATDHALRPVPTPVFLATSSTNAIEAVFAQEDFGSALMYEVHLFRDGSSTPSATCYAATEQRASLGFLAHGKRNTDKKNICSVSAEKRISPHTGKEIDAIVVSFDGLAHSLTGTFRAKVKGCREITPKGSLNCGSLGDDGGRTVVRRRSASQSNLAFAQKHYSFSVSENIATGTVAGVLTATSTSATTSYSIVAGDAGQQFAVASGATSTSITVAKSLDYETKASYTLTVQAADSRGGLATTTVAITVTDVIEVSPPVLAFGQKLYSFSVREDVATGTVAGVLTATSTSATTTYSIVAGDVDRRFAVSSGATSTSITVAKSLDYETKASYTLTVQVSDSRGGLATTTVAITVTDVAETLPDVDAPRNLNLSATGQTFTITWSAVTGADRYRVQELRQQWTDIATTSSTSLAFNPQGGPSCGTTYQFRALARGDGASRAATWSTPSDPVLHWTGRCNRHPQLSIPMETVPLSKKAAVHTLVTTVAASDPDGDVVSYSITAGNRDNSFVLLPYRGQLRVAGELWKSTTTPYVLTIQADDGNGGTATTTLEVVMLAEQGSASPFDTPPASAARSSAMPPASAMRRPSMRRGDGIPYPT